MNSLEIFSGAGGLAKGLELAGFNHSAFIEFNKHACLSLQRNFDPKKVFCGDVRDFDFSKLTSIDVVAGGPPCQPFSMGGKHQANADTRDMFPYAIKAIEKLRPKAFIFENVKGLLRPTFAEYFEYVLLRLAFPDSSLKLGQAWEDHLAALRKTSICESEPVQYRVTRKLLNAADFGVPQCRERVVIVGIRSDIDCQWQFPEPTHSYERLTYEKHVSGDYWKRHGVPPILAAPSSLADIQRASQSHAQHDLFAGTLKPWQTVRDALAGVADPRDDHGIVDHKYQGGARTYSGHTGSELDLPAKTIKAGGHGVPGGENMIRFADGSVRYFTTFEAKRIQTFPDDFMIEGAWGEAMRQVGNAVPVLLAQRLGDNLMKSLVTKARKVGARESRMRSVAVEA